VSSRNVLDDFGKGRPMNWEIVIGLIIVIPMTLFGLIRLPKIWAGQDQDLMEIGTAALPMSQPLRRGFVRGTVVGIFVCGALVVCAPAAAVADATNGRVASTATGVALGALVAFAVLSIINLGVLLFNRPKFAVPPCYRQEPGAVATWVRAARGKR
jgi:uncharacterized protein YqgC (DUF456 family)